MVCDVDEHPHLNEALQKAEINEFKVALSDPCIELWFLLHREGHTTRIHRHDAQRKAKAHFPGMTDKTWPFDRYHTDEAYLCAVARAQVLERRATTTGQRNPSTSLYRLTEAIRAPTGHTQPPPACPEQAGTPSQLKRNRTRKGR